MICKDGDEKNRGMPCCSDLLVKGFGSDEFDSSIIPVREQRR